MDTLLIIGYTFPEPSTTAAGKRMMQLISFFEEHKFHIVFSSTASITDKSVSFMDSKIEIKKIKLNDPSFNDFIKELNPAMVLFDRFVTEEKFGWRVAEYCPEAIRILDTEDLQCLRNARHEAFKGERDFTTSDLHSDIAKREIAAILRCDLSLIISSYEMSLLNSVFKIEPSLLHHLPFMVDLSSLPISTKTFEQRQHFMTIGNFRHAPNWDAVLYLQKIWPLIRKQLPKAELHIYGSYPPPKATALNNPKTGFLIKGWADNAFDVMQSARVCLAPLRFGAGIKGKLLEAMIMQTPSVTTNIGAEGMHNDLPWPGKIANTADDFANAAVEMYTNQSDFEQAQQDGNTLLNTLYDKAQLSTVLIKKIDSISSDLNAHREKNFTGQMLKHHTMRSTQYMSQWIAEKNKKLD